MYLHTITAIDRVSDDICLKRCPNMPHHGILKLRIVYHMKILQRVIVPKPGNGDFADIRHESNISHFKLLSRNFVIMEYSKWTICSISLKLIIYSSQLFVTGIYFPPLCEGMGKHPQRYCSRVLTIRCNNANLVFSKSELNQCEMFRTRLKFGDRLFLVI